MVTKTKYILMGVLITIASACEHEGGIETSSDGGIIVSDADTETQFDGEVTAPDAEPETPPDIEIHSIGPSNIGFFSSVAFHPSRTGEVWASGDDSSGLYKSTMVAIPGVS